MVKLRLRELVIFFGARDKKFKRLRRKILHIFYAILVEKNNNNNKASKYNDELTVRRSATSEKFLMNLP